MDKNKKKAAVFMLAVFAIVIVTLSASYAIFNYSRTGSKVNKIQMGDIEFAMLDGTEVSLTNEFPESDTEGNKNTPYRFTVTNNSTSGLTLYYNISFVTNNTETGVDYFTNNQIKYSLVKNEYYKNDTSSTSGNKLSTIDGFNETSTQGDGIVLENQAITAKNTDSYELRIWISDDVKYNTEPDSNGLSTGKYNDYKYSLKVRINANTSGSAENQEASGISYQNTEYTTCNDVSCSLNELYDLMN